MGYSFVCFEVRSAGSPTDDQYGPIIFRCFFHGSPCCYNNCRIHLILFSIIILLVVSLCMTDCLQLHPLLPSLLILSPGHFHLDSCLLPVVCLSLLNLFHAIHCCLLKGLNYCRYDKQVQHLVKVNHPVIVSSPDFITPRHVFLAETTVGRSNVV